MVQMLSPLCPHLAEELWSRLGNDQTVTFVPFPVADQSLLVEETIEYPVQINGKVRTRLTVPHEADQATIQALALADEKVIAALDGEVPKKIIVIPGRMVNLVV
jgi:leucyl-tRNA synthetase